MKDTLIKVDTASTQKLDPEMEHLHQQHVRLYSAGPTWASLQIRSYGPINPSGYGKSHNAYSDASLTVETATQLRNALNVWLSEHQPLSSL